MRSIPPQPRRSGRKVKRWWESPSNGFSEPHKKGSIMDYATLGNRGLLVSKLCFGTMTFGDGRGLFKAISTAGQSAADELARKTHKKASKAAPIFCKFFLFKELNFTKRTPLR